MLLEVLEVDALRADVDVLAVKYAQDRYGVDLKVYGELAASGVAEEDMRPAPWTASVVRAEGGLRPRSIIFVGMPDLTDITYEGLTEFAKTAVQTAARLQPLPRTLGLTLHGANFGLDEGQAFLSMIAGLEQALHDARLSKRQFKVVFLELERSRARFLRDLLNELGIESASDNGNPGVDDESTSHTRLQKIARESATRPHAFVAMPFDEGFRDVYDYAIQNAVNQSGLLCERVDVSSFTGDILAHIKERIRRASILIADLSTANPNVYLELGYAWGCGIPSVLLVRDTSELKFDVRGQRCIAYKRIRELETKLPQSWPGFERRLTRRCS